jgi:hypothetical protein
MQRRDRNEVERGQATVVMVGVVVVAVVLLLALVPVARAVSDKTRAR